MEWDTTFRAEDISENIAWANVVQFVLTWLIFMGCCLGQKYIYTLQEERSKRIRLVIQFIKSDVRFTKYDVSNLLNLTSDLLNLTSDLLNVTHMIVIY